jgi:hypothetical protein
MGTNCKASKGEMKMEDKDIERLFLSVAEASENQSSEVKDVFSILVRSTLQYRDDMLASEGIIITVEDVRVTLEHLIPFLETGRLPAKTDHVKIDLLKIWKNRLRRLENSNKNMI